MVGVLIMLDDFGDRCTTIIVCNVMVLMGLLYFIVYKERGGEEVLENCDRYEELLTRVYLED